MSGGLKGPFTVPTVGEVAVGLAFWIGVLCGAAGVCLAWFLNVDPTQ